MARKPPKTLHEGPLTLQWTLDELPTSQHKTGLAGLVLVLRWMERQPDPKGVCRLDAVERDRVTITVDREGMGALFDVIYGAALVETETSKPWKKKNEEIVPPKTTREVERDGKSTTMYVYDSVQPAGGPLHELDPEGASGPWVKQWRDAVWSILRGIPATRAPFEARAHGTPTTDAADTFEALASKPDACCDLPSTYYLGAQAITADNVPFQDRQRLLFLLHFWPFAAQLYVPAVPNKDKPSQRDFVGVVFTFPDIADLEVFTEELPDALRLRSADRFGYRPKGAVIDLAAESALDLLSLLRHRLQERGVEDRLQDIVHGIDVFHAEKEGNNIRNRGTFRITTDPQVIQRFESAQRTFWTPHFRAIWLGNLISGRPWHHGFGAMLSTRPRSHTIQLQAFQHDAKEAFRHEGVMMSQQPERSESPPTLESVLWKVVGGWLDRRLQAKYGLGWRDASQSDEGKARYGEEREKLARGAFLTARSRTGSAFQEFFTSTLLSVAQHLREPEYRLLAQALLHDTETVRTLTLLALSARA